MLVVPGPLNYKQIPLYTSQLTLADGDSDFELHEYPGNWQYGTLSVSRRRWFSADSAESDAFDLSAWSVAYPWRDDAVFNSSDDLLNRVWALCRDTLKHTSLDTFTDSNTRECTPYEADGFVTSRSWSRKQLERSGGCRISVIS